MKETQLKIEYLPLASLKMYEKNAKKHEEYDVDELVKSIEKFGFNDAIGIWSDKNIIVEGHGRYLAATKLGLDAVPCIRLDHLTDEERRQYAIIHNKTTELSKWDFEILAEELDDLDLSDFNIDFDLPNDDIEWADVDDLEEKAYDEPEHRMLECPSCHHIDRDIHFKKV